LFYIKFSNSLHIYETIKYFVPVFKIMEEKEDAAVEKEEKEMSLQEEKVDCFLHELGLITYYESPVFVSDDKKRPRVWSPDFFLPELGIYIEVCGAKRRAYKYRREIYQKNKIPVIFVKTYFDEKSWKEWILKGIREIHHERNELIKNKNLFLKLSIN
jgi:hypothetical protein